MIEAIEMKDSGIEWIGKIPKYWILAKIKNSFKKILSGSTPSTSRDDYYTKEIPWFVSGDLKDTEISQARNFISKKALNEINGLQIIPENTLLIAMIGATVGKVGLLKIPATINQNCCALIGHQKILPKFLFYWFIGNRDSIISQSAGGAQSIMNSEIIKNLIVPIPPSEKEQEKIIIFIEKKILQTDLSISRYQRLTELLLEKRQAMIDQTITKGLNYHVATKESGIEWIGNIPKHWKLNKIKYSSYVKGRIGWQGLNSDEFIEIGPYLVTGTEFKSGKVDWEHCYHVESWRYDQNPYIQIKNDDILITKDGTIGKVALVENIPGPATLNAGLMVIRPLNNDYLPKFMYWVLQSHQFTHYIGYVKTGATIKHLYQETFENFIFAYTKFLDEQKQITEFLDSETFKIDSLVLKIKSQIFKLQEFRKSLIETAITGKLYLKEEVVV